MEHPEIMAALAPVDGVRGTWKWMLSEGNHGYGLVPWVSNIMYWDQLGSYPNVAQACGDPIFTPALVRWEAIENDVTKIPVVKVVLISAFGAGNDYWPGTVLLNTSVFDDDETNDPWDNFVVTGEFELPVWAVTPIPEEDAMSWAKHSNIYWDSLPETWRVTQIFSDMEHGSYDAHGELIPCILDDITVSHWQFGSGVACDCGLEADIELLTEREWTGSYFPFERNELNERFFIVWDWGFTRYLRATANLHELEANNIRNESLQCLSFWVSSQSPFWATQPSSEWIPVSERKLSTPLTSSQLSLDFSTVA